MGESALGVYFRVAGVIAVACLTVLFFLEAGSAEFLITVLSFVMSATVAVICGILLNKEK